MKIKNYKNGITLVVDKKTSYDCIAANICVKVGACFENESEKGLSHFVEHLFFKSTKNHSAEKLSEMLENNGARINAFTGMQTTNYCLKAPLFSFCECFKLYSEMFFDGLYKQDEIDKEKQVILEEYKRGIDKDFKYLISEMFKVHFKNTALNFLPIGKQNVIQNATRENIIQFKNKHYTANNTIISFCGNITFKKAQKLVEEYFCKRFTNSANKNQLLLQKVNQERQSFCLERETKSQVQISVFFDACEVTDENYHNYRALSAILGSGLSCILFNKLRVQQGLCYSVSSHIFYYGKNTIVGFDVATSPEKVEKTVLGLKKCLHEICENGVVLEDVVKVKNKFKSAFVMDKKYCSIADNNVDDIVDFGKIISVKEKLKYIQQINQAEIKKCAQNLVNSKHITIGAVGPKVDIKVLKKFFK